MSWAVAFVRKVSSFFQGAGVDFATFIGKSFRGVEWICPDLIKEDLCVN